jgi:hypothetical protein
MNMDCHTVKHGMDTFDHRESPCKKEVFENAVGTRRSGLPGSLLGKV